MDTIIPDDYETEVNPSDSALIHIRKRCDGDRWLFLRDGTQLVSLTSIDQAIRYAGEHARLGLPYDQAVPLKQFKWE